MTTRVSMRAQAKLNLWLRVLAREESGYHSIETLFHRIELADDVSVSLADTGERSIECSVDVCAPQENLAYRAAVDYCALVDWATGFRVEITKRIPAAGGLGGGSADAAATLVCLNAISPQPIGDDALALLGRELGADVPYLLTQAPAALAWGHGDRLLELDALPQRHVALVVPDFGIVTADAYRSLPADRRPGPKQLSQGDLTNWGRVAEMAHNDLCDSEAVRGHPRISGSIAALRAAGAEVAGMTGSGSVVFGIFAAPPDPQGLGRLAGGQVLLTLTALNVEGSARLD
jgi:4-diphosphocytidyl-2-C-methyl-D-erythritol kinase